MATWRRCATRPESSDLARPCTSPTAGGGCARRGQPCGSSGATGCAWASSASPMAASSSSFQAHWWRDAPERSPTTGAMRPPYREALDRTVAYDGDDLRRELERGLRETRPTTVAFPDPLDRHPDHSATGVFVLLALGDRLARDGPGPRLRADLAHWPA